MLKQGVVTNPQFKPVVLKSSSADGNSSSNDEDLAMPLEYFSAYELQLQETLLELNSELERWVDVDQKGSHSHLDSRGDSSDEEHDRPLDSCQNKVQLLETKKPDELETDAELSTEYVLTINAYELRMQEAIDDLTDLSGILVSFYSNLPGIFNILAISSR